MKKWLHNLFGAMSRTRRTFTNFLSFWRGSNVDRQAQGVGLLQGAGAIGVVAGGIAAGPLSDEVSQLVNDLISKCTVTINCILLHACFIFPVSKRIPNMYY